MTSFRWFDGQQWTAFAVVFRSLALRARGFTSTFGLLLLIAGLALLGCRPPGGPVDLPPPQYSSTLGPSDDFELRILPARELPVSYQVQPDGSVAIPYVGRIQVAGLEPHEIEKTVRDQLIAQEIFTNPSVSVLVKAYRSKRVQILGQVKKPDSYAFEPGMSLLRLISLAGGFTELADDDYVTIRRKLKNGTIKVVELSVDDIIANRIPDVPLQAGDSVNVPKSAI